MHFRNLHIAQSSCCTASFPLWLLKLYYCSFILQDAITCVRRISCATYPNNAFSNLSKPGNLRLLNRNRAVVMGQYTFQASRPNCRFTGRTAKDASRVTYANTYICWMNHHREHICPCWWWRWWRLVLTYVQPAPILAISRNHRPLGMTFRCHRYDCSYILRAPSNETQIKEACLRKGQEMPLKIGGPTQK